MISTRVRETIEAHIAENIDTYRQMPDNVAIYYFDETDDKTYTLFKQIYYYQEECYGLNDQTFKDIVLNKALATLPPELIVFSVVHREGYDVNKLCNTLTFAIHCLEVK